MLKVKKYQPGELILSHNKRSTINDFHMPYLVPQVNAIYTNVMKKREKAD